MRPAASGASLFEENYTISFGVKETTIVGDETCARPAMQEHNRLSVRVAALFVIEFVNWRDADVTAVIRFDLRIKGS